MIFDTHAHYDDEAFQEDRDSLLMSLKDNDIGAVINVAADMESVETPLPCHRSTLLSMQPLASILPALLPLQKKTCSTS